MNSIRIFHPLVSRFTHLYPGVFLLLVKLFSQGKAQKTKLALNAKKFRQKLFILDPLKSWTYLAKKKSEEKVRVRGKSVCEIYLRVRERIRESERV